MRAKVAKDYRHPIVRAFGGLEFVKSEYRRVPDGMANEADRLVAAGLLEIEAAPTPLPEPASAPLDITDAAFALAVDNDLNPRRIIGTGAGGRILVGDVRALLEEEE